VRLQLVHALSLPHVRDVLAVPLQLTLPDGTVISVSAPGDDSPKIELVLVTSIDVSQLYISVSELPPGERTLVAPEVQYLRDVASDFAGALSFLTDSALVPRSPKAALLPDSTDDEELLRSHPYPVDDGTIRTVHALIRAIDPAAISRERLLKLLAKQEGLHLYREALRLETPVAQYRELWRLLESAFGCQDEELAQRLADYPPAVALRFTIAELRKLLIIRHRTSHAATRAGLAELRSASSQAAKLLDRLKCLAERVLVTKASWGAPTLEVDELSPLANYFTSDGGALIRHKSGVLRL
jgi:hypothetical protein